MKNVMPPSTMIAPIATTAVSVPVKPPPLEELELGLVTTGAAGLGVAGVVVAGAVGVGVCDWGKPGASGFPVPGLGVPEPWARASDGAPRATRAAQRSIATEAGRKTLT
jgi:hypothetical protein